MHFVLFYEFVPDYLERRQAFRAAHLAKAWEAVERGELLLAGALAEPADGGLIIFTAETREVAERFAAADPYVKNGLVSRWFVRPWTTVVGENATTPMR